MAIVILLVLAITYFATINENKAASHFKDNIYFSEKVTYPVVYGIINPRIILPLAYKEKDVDLVVLHERMHIKRGDNLWRISAFGGARIRARIENILSYRKMTGFSLIVFIVLLGSIFMCC